MKKVLVTGFEPFAGEPINAAWEAVQALESRIDVAVQQLPTAFDRAIEALRSALETVNPDVVVCFGEAGGRTAVSIERIGVNLDDARIPDNAGQQPRERPIVPAGPDAYFSGLPVRELVQTLRAAGIPAEESWSAGHFVCNHVLYGLMHLLAQPCYANRRVAGGFVHLPYLPEQAARHDNAASLGRAEAVRAVELIVKHLVDPAT